jgi:trigger factor
MKSNLEKTGSLQRKLNVQVPAEVVNETLTKLLKTVQTKAEIKGFRKGKAPITTIKSIYGDRVKQDAIQEIVQNNYLVALKEHKVMPLGYPEFEFNGLSEGQEFQFSAHFDVKPEIELKKYTGLEVQTEKLNVTDESVNKILENIRNSNAKTVDLLIQRPVQKGDTAIIDFAGFIDGKPLDKGNGTDFPLEIGANQFIPGFEDGIIGMNASDVKTLDLQFPDDYGSEDLKGKKVAFNVTLKAIKKRELPELNDAFVAELMKGANPGEPTTLESLKQTIRKDLEDSEGKRIQNDLKNRLLKVLVQNNPVDVPPSMQKEQVGMLVEDTKNRMMGQGLSEGEFEQYKTKWASDFETVAAEMIQAGFLIDQIALKHNLHWTEEDFNNKMKEYAVQTGIAEERVREYYGTEEQKSKLTYMMTEEKVIKYLMENNKVTEVSADKLKAN